MLLELQQGKRLYQAVVQAGDEILKLWQVDHGFVNAAIREEQARFYFLQGLVREHAGCLLGRESFLYTSFVNYRTIHRYFCF